ncbi:MAG: hypothetical protein JO144_16920 [Actinobacteria bacterium]|nr:hypothetical protein [Actinomycetota bacterium]
MEDNSHAGQGPVVLDIGGDIGALVVSMPAALSGAEVEARPVAGEALGSYADHLPHVAVLARPGSPVRHVAVFAELRAGEYELHLRPDHPVRLTAVVRGGEVSTAAWPAEPG